MRQLHADRFEIGMPDDWLDQSTVTLVGPVRPGFAPNVMVNHEPAPAGLTLDEYFAAQQRELADLEAFTVAEQGDRLLGGQRALYHRYTWVSPQKLQLTQLQLMCLTGGIVYTLTASATSTDWPQFDLTFEQVIAHFRFR